MQRACHALYDSGEERKSIALDYINEALKYDELKSEIYYKRWRESFV